MGQDWRALPRASFQSAAGMPSAGKTVRGPRLSQRAACPKPLAWEPMPERRRQDYSVQQPGHSLSPQGVPRPLVRWRHPSRPEGHVHWFRWLRNERLAWACSIVIGNANLCTLVTARRIVCYGRRTTVLARISLGRARSFATSSWESPTPFGPATAAVSRRGLAPTA